MTNYPSSKLESLISKGQTEEAIEVLKEVIQELNQDCLPRLINLQSRYSHNNKNALNGTADMDNTSIELNRINSSFLAILSEVREKVQSHINFYKPIPKDIENRSTLRDFVHINLQKKLHDIEAYAEGTDFIYFKGKKNDSGLDVMIMILKNGDSTNIKNNKHLKTILKLKHRNLIQLYELNFHTYPYYIITEFIPGINLEVLLSKLGPLPLHNVKRLMHTIGDVMNNLRKKKFPFAGLRPSKIIIDDELEPEISPFALFITSDKKRLYKTFKEDCLYFSPETLYDLEDYQGSERNDKSNQFCLATLGFEMLTGTKLFEGTTVEDILLRRHRFFNDQRFRNEILTHPRLTKRMASILKKMLRFDPQKRYDNMSVALREIDRVRSDFDKDELQAFNSYRRSLEYTDDFVELFYNNLFSHSYMNAFKPKTPAEKVALHQKFYVDLHLLFDVENAIASIDRMATLAHGEENPKSEYVLFLDVFIETIAQCDPRYKPNSPTEKAWKSVKKRVYEGLEIPLSELETTKEVLSLLEA